VLGVWRPWAEQLTGSAIDSSHFIPEERPQETAERLLKFL
jgi:haloacetate dehalogenase